MEHRWHYFDSGKQQGPISLEQLRELLSTARIGPHTEVWQEGTPDFRMAVQVEELRDLFSETVRGDSAVRERTLAAALPDLSLGTQHARIQHAGDRLPQPLQDPLRRLSRFIGTLIVVLVVATGYSCFSWELHPRWLLILPQPFLFWLWCILPHRPVNAIYLRSFAQDTRNGQIRSLTQAALGDDFRLGGIRAPNRRWPLAFRMMDVFLFAIRYSSPRYMNLEAGSDWKARLWSTMREARCAIIDVANITGFVEEEIELSHAALGLDRILFVLDTSRSADDWKKRIVRALYRADEQVEAAMHVAIWDDSRAGRKAFAASVRAFKAALPGGTRGKEISGRHLAQNNTAPEGEDTSWKKSAWIQLPIGIVLAILLHCGGILQTELRDSYLRPPVQMVWTALATAYLIVQLIFLCQYIREAGTLRKSAVRLCSFLVLAVGGTLLPIYGMVEEVRMVRNAAERVMLQNNLKQIGLAYYAYDGVFHKAPATAEDLLPFLDNDNRLFDLLKKEVVLIYNVRISGGMPEGPSNTILGYYRDAPTQGGSVLFGDGTEQWLSAEEFHKTPQAPGANQN